MAEIVSDDVLDWARDLAEIMKLLNGNCQQPVVHQSAVIVDFAPRQSLLDPSRKIKIAD